MQHAHVCKLIDHPPVVSPALRLSALATSNAQVDGVEIPGEKQGTVCQYQTGRISCDNESQTALVITLILMHNIIIHREIMQSFRAGVTTVRPSKYSCAYVQQ